MLTGMAEIVRVMKSFDAAALKGTQSGVIL
jgi:hypothetical protein